VRGEYVDGRVVEEEMPDYAHELIVAWLLHALRTWLGTRGFVAGSGVKFAVRADRGRMPDLHVFLPHRAPPPRSGLVHEPPDVVVEVLSPTPSDRRRDRVEKLGEYAGFGVRWYWIVDPDARTLEILELREDGHYALAAATSTGTLADVPGCPELVLELDAMWAELDRLGPPAP